MGEVPLYRAIVEVLACPFWFCSRAGIGVRRMHFWITNYVCMRMYPLRTCAQVLDEASRADRAGIEAM